MTKPDITLPQHNAILFVAEPCTVSATCFLIRKPPQLNPTVTKKTAINLRESNSRIIPSQARPATKKTKGALQRPKNLTIRGDKIRSDL